MKPARKGFATVMALVLLSMVGITVTGIMARLSIDARRTAREADRAQQTQILFARSLGEPLKLPEALRSR